MKYRNQATSKYSSHRRRPVSSLLKILDSGFRRNDKIRIICLLLACLITPAAHATRLGRLFFTPEQRTQLEYDYARTTAVEGDSSSVLMVNGIVQKHGGARTVWINGVPQKAGNSDERSPEALPVAVPGKSQPVKIKVGQKILLDQPAQQNPTAPNN